MANALYGAAGPASKPRECREARDLVALCRLSLDALDTSSRFRSDRSKDGKSATTRTTAVISFLAAEIMPSRIAGKFSASTGRELRIVNVSDITPAAATGTSLVRPRPETQAIGRLAADRRAPDDYSFTRQDRSRRDVHEFGSGARCHTHLPYDRCDRKSQSFAGAPMARRQAEPSSILQIAAGIARRLEGND